MSSLYVCCSCYTRYLSSTDPRRWWWTRLVCCAACIAQVWLDARGLVGIFSSCLLQVSLFAACAVQSRLRASATSRACSARAGWSHGSGVCQPRRAQGLHCQVRLEGSHLAVHGIVLCPSLTCDAVPGSARTSCWPCCTRRRCERRTIERRGPGMRWWRVCQMCFAGT
jgi:hypothetical protein